MAELRPISKEARVSEKVFAQLRDAIFDGTFQPGDKFPTEIELGDMFQVSRTSVREATKLLAGQGLIVIKPGLGAYVAEAQGNDFAADLQKLLSREKETILELFQIRKFLDVEAAAAAAQKASPADILEIEGLLDEAERLVHSPADNRRKLFSLNTKFHFLLVKATGNRTLLKVMTSLMEMLRNESQLTTQLPGRDFASVAGHREILAAVRDRNSDKARMCMLKHLESVENVVKSLQ
ncbi:MAG: FadR/GntR family transcriptional regulator [Negativicutes bacterium]|nr:FadR/GntR family transcriptional regulator [Negativicutes bacterium]